MVKMYGIWIPGQGWLRAANACVAFSIEDVAIATARRCGNGARVEYMDDSLQDLEPYFLSIENINKRKTLKELLHGLSRRFN
jgi:hypothetical protein